MKKLSKCKQGIVYKIIDIKGNPETQKHLHNIGLEIGDAITIISKLASNLIINIKDSRFGIDLRVAKLIEVEPWTEI